LLNKVYFLAVSKVREWEWSRKHLLFIQLIYDLVWYYSE
jgi:hypothetical protein